jgi:hypothetical protein
MNANEKGIKKNISKENQSQKTKNELNIFPKMKRKEKGRSHNLRSVGR